MQASYFFSISEHLISSSVREPSNQYQLMAFQLNWAFTACFLCVQGTLWEVQIYANSKTNLILKNCNIRDKIEEGWVLVRFPNSLHKRVGGFRPGRRSIFQNDGMDNFFFQATIGINGFSMVCGRYICVKILECWGKKCGRTYSYAILGTFWMNYNPYHVLSPKQPYML